MLEMLLDAWLEQREKDKVAATTAFAALDHSGRGLHTVTEFCKVLRVVDSAAAKALSSEAMTEAFREAVRLQGGGGAVHADAFAEVLLRRGLTGLKGHQLALLTIPVPPPWDGFQALEESWSGMRGELEQMLVVAEQLPSKVPAARPPFTLSQLRRWVRSLASVSCCVLHWHTGSARDDSKTGPPQLRGDSWLHRQDRIALHDKRSCVA